MAPPEISVPFNRPLLTGDERRHVLSAIESRVLRGDGPYSKRCERWFEDRLGCARALMVPSCTQALEMAALLLDIESGDEIIMPSFTFVSTANAFVLRGAKIVFVDVHPGTMNLDVNLLEAAVTPRTRAVVVVHYGGVGCAMEALLRFTEKHNLCLIEDAAQGMMADYAGRPLGSFGQLAAISFHESKNFTSGGEGGLIVVNSRKFAERAEILREKGTNRSAFFRGDVDKYTWRDIGSSYLPGELQCAYLWGQLSFAERVTEERRGLWQRYHDMLRPLAERGLISLPEVPQECRHNGHLFFIKCETKEIRACLTDFLRERGITAPFHYLPLHLSPAGQRYGRFSGSDQHTVSGSERLLRLPLWYGLSEAQQSSVLAAMQSYFRTACRSP